jgi:hypothetical protein
MPGRQLFSGILFLANHELRLPVEIFNEDEGTNPEWPYYRQRCMPQLVGAIVVHRVRLSLFTAIAVRMLHKEIRSPRLTGVNWAIWKASKTI